MTHAQSLTAALLTALMLGACGGGGSSTSSTSSASPASKYAGTFNFCSDGQQQKLILSETGSNTLSVTTATVNFNTADCSGQPTAPYVAGSGTHEADITFLRSEPQATVISWPTVGQTSALPVDVFLNATVGGASYDVGLMLINNSALYVMEKLGDSYVARSHYDKE